VWRRRHLITIASLRKGESKFLNGAFDWHIAPAKKPASEWMAAHEQEMETEDC